MIGPGATVPITVPSRGATWFMWSIMRMPPAPGINCATTFGLPGMYLPRCRAITRAPMSMPPPAVPATRMVTCLPL